MNPNPSLPQLIARIDDDFSYHKPKEGQFERYEAIRAKAKELAVLIAESVPAGREQSLALTQLEQAMFWSNAGIARH
jgi:hypothetical protein